MTSVGVGGAEGGRKIFNLYDNENSLHVQSSPELPMHKVYDEHVQSYLLLIEKPFWKHFFYQFEHL